MILKFLHVDSSIKKNFRVNQGDENNPGLEISMKNMVRAPTLGKVDLKSLGPKNRGNLAKFNWGPYYLKGSCDIICTYNQL